MQDTNIPIDNLHEHSDINPLEMTPMIQPPSTTIPANDGKGIVFAPEIRIVQGDDYSQKHGVQDFENNIPSIMHNNHANGHTTNEETAFSTPSFPENTIDVNKITPDVIVQKQE